MLKSGENGWISILASKEVGGLQMPAVFSTAASFILGAANYSGCVFVGLTMGAAHLIETFADKKYHDVYLPKMFAGQWQGTMALTGPVRKSERCSNNNRKTGRRHLYL